jgi:hypothetical protein
VPRPLRPEGKATRQDGHYSLRRKEQRVSPCGLPRRSAQMHGMQRSAWTRGRVPRAGGDSRTRLARERDPSHRRSHRTTTCADETVHAAHQRHRGRDRRRRVGCADGDHAPRLLPGPAALRAAAAGTRPCPAADATVGHNVATVSPDDGAPVSHSRGMADGRRAPPQIRAHRQRAVHVRAAACLDGASPR